MVSGDRGSSAITTSLEGGGGGGSSRLTGTSAGDRSDDEDWDLSEGDMKCDYTTALANTTGGHT